MHRSCRRGCRIETLRMPGGQGRPDIASMRICCFETPARLPSGSKDRRPISSASESAIASAITTLTRSNLPDGTIPAITKQTRRRTSAPPILRQGAGHRSPCASNRDLRAAMYGRTMVEFAITFATCPGDESRCESSHTGRRSNLCHADWAETDVSCFFGTANPVDASQEARRTAEMVRIVAETCDRRGDFRASGRHMNEFPPRPLRLTFDVASRLQASAIILNFAGGAPFLHIYVAGCLHMIHLLPRMCIAQRSLSAVQSCQGQMPIPNRTHGARVNRRCTNR
jgi:hypothetical protein